MPNKTLILRLREEDRGLIGEILLSQNPSNDEESQIIWGDYFIKYKIFHNLNVTQRYFFMKAYARSVIKLGFDTVLKIARFQKEAGKSAILSEGKPDYFYNSLQVNDSFKVDTFIRGLTFELLRNVTRAQYLTYSRILQTLALIEGKRE